jgi:hypothetical protein
MKDTNPPFKTGRTQETRKTLNTIHRTKNTDPKKLLLLDKGINNKNEPTMNQTVGNTKART